jgi:hypothetical protein
VRTHELLLAVVPQWDLIARFGIDIYGGAVGVEERTGHGYMSWNVQTFCAKHTLRLVLEL